MIPLGWCFTTRQRDEDAHWWDTDPEVRARNLRWEDSLDSVLRHEYGNAPAPQRRKDDSDVHPLIRYGVRVGIPSVMAALLVYWLTMKIDAKLEDNTSMLRNHAMATTALAEQATRSERLMERAVALMFVQCFNAAKSAAERGECSRASR